MTIYQACEKYRISLDTLRYYKRIGAITPVNRTKSGIRDYTEQDIINEKGLDYFSVTKAFRGG